jgi:uncharacterized protein with von Willebrand factor type A (vWA) domain
MTEMVPRALTPFLTFTSVLRANQFAVAPEQTQGFIAAVGLLGPRSVQDIYRAAVALLAPPPERREDFDALFRRVFHGQTLAGAAPDTVDDDELQAFDDRDGGDEPPEEGEESDSGGEATRGEVLHARAFTGGTSSEALARFARQAPGLLPRRLSRRRRVARRGVVPDMRGALRAAVRHDGEVIDLPMLAKRRRQRRILLLIDVSGSMKAQTESHLRFAHALARAADQVEVFTLGTRLTRITRALRLRQREQAFATASTLVADWDGGTRLGDALDAFLAVPRFAGFARGALVLVLSDGLERSDPAILISATRRLQRLAWAILWLSPLAGEWGFAPETEALSALIPSLAHLGSASDLSRICAEVLAFSRRAA